MSSPHHALASSSDAPDAADPVKLADMWSVSGQLLHTEAYRRTHARLLAEAIGHREQKILDAACGMGFPMRELHDLGFTNLCGSDADPDLIAKFRALLAAAPATAQWRPRLMVATWQELPQRLPETFDVVLNVDAAIGFMDSWLPGEMRVGSTRIFARVVAVLRNFHAVTAPGGRFFIGLQKNNHKGNSFYPMHVGRMSIDGVPAEAQWDMTYDWTRRIKTWVNTVRIDDRAFSQTRQSYLFDLAELGDFLLAAGFAHVERLPTPDDLYEDILIAHRGDEAA
ncbi:MAG: class I SAM-dependent methyltransferase [Rhodospirillaceae bacterium]|nr:class I SAM-dependent methyltransferase [Rhodospirillaceae bacterium]